MAVRLFTWAKTMEMHHVRYFMAVCDTLNFTRAAEQCAVSQPSLTKGIKKLEEALGGELFRRERSKTHLTDLGRIVRPHLAAIQNARDAAVVDAENFHTLETAHLKLGVMSTIGPAQMVGFLASLREELSTLDLTVSEAPGEALVDSLLAGDLDVALIGLPALPERLDALPLYSERYMIAFAQGHHFESQNAVSADDLDGEDYLIRLHCEYLEHYGATGRTPSFDVNVRYSSEREDWIQAMVLAKIGCCIMPEFLPTLSGIAMRPIIDPEVSRTISLVTVAGRQFTPTLRLMRQMAQRYKWPGDSEQFHQSM